MHRVVDGANPVTVHVPLSSHALLVHGLVSEHGAPDGCAMFAHAPDVASQKL